MTHTSLARRALAASVFASLALVALLPAACGSSTNTGGTSDAGADGTNPGSNGCVQAGGTCGCNCGPGTKLAPGPLGNQCPQPCAQCGACSQQCCLPDPVDAGGDAKSDGGCSGTFNCLCGSPYCDNGQWKCTSCGGNDAGGG